MKELSTAEILEQYIKSGKIIYETTLSGDYKKGNKEMKKIVKLTKYLADNIEIAKVILKQLFKNENVEIRTEAAIHAIMLNIYIQEAKEILEEIAGDKKYGIFSINAGIGLENLNNGNIRMY